ncbi:MAG: hypothetical protein NXH85_18850 [Pseudomonadaceae bacterium]|nr:hypothetical protein [Pseudomonadaceae bacterium]
MNIDLAINLWRTTPAPDQSLTPSQAELKKRQRRLAGQVRRRDWTEAIVGCICTAFFAYIALADVFGGMRWDWLAVAMGCGFVSAFMIRERVLVARVRQANTQPLVQSLENDLRAVERQIYLLRNVAWWYVLPIELPMLFVALTGPEFASIRALFITMGVVLALVIIALNRWVVRKTLLPQRKALIAALNDLREGLDSPT